MKNLVKTVCAVIREKIKYEGELTLSEELNVITKKLNIFLHKISESPFRTDPMEWFNLWDQ